MPLYQWDALDPLTCIEVVFGSGDIFRTGSAAGPGTLDEQWKTGQAQVRPMGPGATDFARVVQGAQGTMGIVTWATLKCENLHDVQKPYVIGSDEYLPLADFAYRLMWNKAGDECLIFSRAQLAAVMGVNAEEAGRIRDTLPSWVLFFCLSGYKYAPEEKIAFKEKTLVKEAKKIGVQFKGAVASLSGGRILKVLNRPSSEPYWKLRQKGGCQDLFFLSTLDKVPEFIRVMAETADQLEYPFSEMGIYVQPMVQGTSCHCEFDIFYDPGNRAEAAKVEELYDKASLALLNAGAYYSRPYGKLSDIAYGKDAEMTAAVRKLKGIFDPNNVMNTGKLCF
jgi:FAD/FMN-containing dehydrogenase